MSVLALAEDAQPKRTNVKGNEVERTSAALLQHLVLMETVLADAKNNHVVEISTTMWELEIEEYRRALASLAVYDSGFKELVGRWIGVWRMLWDR